MPLEPGRISFRLGLGLGLGARKDLLQVRVRVRCQEGSPSGGGRRCRSLSGLVGPMQAQCKLNARSLRDQYKLHTRQEVNMYRPMQARCQAGSFSGRPRIGLRVKVRVRARVGVRGKATFRVSFRVADEYCTRWCIAHWA